jgi:8-oxo-dGTP pyrophosphatase MutT (NUDIX family)
VIRLARAARIEARFEPGPWPWAEREREAIAAHWARRLGRRPAMFDGPVLLARDYALEGEIARVSLFQARYSQFITFRDLDPPDAGALNVFAAAAPRGRDGAYLLGLMAEHTANAGQLYFPCGTPDLSDLRPDGSVDLAGSALRELAEETGLEEDRAIAPAPWTVARDGSILAFLRSAALAEDAEAARARALRHLAADDHPELADLVIIRDATDIDPRVPAYARAFLEDALGLPSPVREGDRG